MQSRRERHSPKIPLSESCEMRAAAFGATSCPAGQIWK
jgi:hypothetical protein